MKINVLESMRFYHSNGKLLDYESFLRDLFDLVIFGNMTLRKIAMLIDDNETFTFLVKAEFVPSENMEITIDKFSLGVSWLTVKINKKTLRTNDKFLLLFTLTKNQDFVSITETTGKAEYKPKMSGVMTVHA